MTELSCSLFLSYLHLEKSLDTDTRSLGVGTGGGQRAMEGNSGCFFVSTRLLYTILPFRTQVFEHTHYVIIRPHYQNNSTIHIYIYKTHHIYWCVRARARRWESTFMNSLLYVGSLSHNRKLKTELK